MSTTFKTIVLAILCVCSNRLFGQNNSQAYQRWAFHSSVGYALPVQRLKSGEITDFLIDYDDEYVYWQFINVEYFFKNNLGINLSIQGNTFTDADERGNLMNAALEERFGNDYFISTSPYSYGQSANINANLYAGLVYAKRFNKISFVPKIQVGFTSFFTNRLNVYLKEKETNTHLQMVYDFTSDRRPQDNFTLLTGITTEFNLTKNLTLDFHLQSSFFKTQFSYVEEIRNTYTEEKSYREFDYSKFLGTLSMGLGVGMKLK